jgi:hypothetical protein
MAGTAEQLRVDQEQKKSFDILASIDLYRFDLQTAGYILPETKQRVYDEELSYIAEGINLPIYTDFHLQKKGGELCYFHEGMWTPYVSTLIKGLDVYQAEAEHDPRKQFMSDRAAEDLLIGYKLDSLKPGEKIKWYADFPDNEYKLYGGDLIDKELGFQSSRRMGFIYEAEGNEDGGINIRSQSVDNSDQEAFAAAMIEGQRGGSITEMRRSYDAVLEAKNGGEFFAGRQLDDSNSEENAWSFVSQNKDLIEDYFMAQIEELAAMNASRNELETAKKRLTYGVWAALKQRLDNSSLSVSAGSHSGLSIHQEVQGAYQSLAARGEVLFGCGGSIIGEQALVSASVKDVFDSIFKTEKMTCPFCDDKDQRGDPCSPNQSCTNCEAKVENGKVTNRGNGGRKKTGSKARTINIFEALSLELSRIDIEISEKRQHTA